MAWIFSSAVVDVVLAGTAISAYGIYAQGQAAKNTAAANADLANREARQNLLLSTVQERLALQQAEWDKQLAESQAAASVENAKAIENEAAARSAQTQENIRRKATEGDRLIAQQRAGYAGAGVLDSTGTPLAVLAETAMNIELQKADLHYENSVNRQKSLFEAQLEKFKGASQSAAAQANYSLSVEASKLRGIAARIGARNKGTQASIDAAAGSNAAANATLSAFGTGLQGAGSAYSLKPSSGAFAGVRPSSTVHSVSALP